MSIYLVLQMRRSDNAIIITKGKSKGLSWHETCGYHLEDRPEFVADNWTIKHGTCTLIKHVFVKKFSNFIQGYRVQLQYVSLRYHKLPY